MSWVAQMRPKTKRMITMSNTNPNPPLGSAPQLLLCDHVGSAPRSSRIKTTTKMMPSVDMTVLLAGSETANKKADEIERHQASDHIGLLVNGPPGARPGCSLSSHPTIFRDYICQLRPQAWQTKELVRSGHCGLSGNVRKNCMESSLHIGHL